MLLRHKIMLLGFFAFLHGTVLACSCKDSKSLAEEINRNTFIIKGIPISADTIGTIIKFGQNDTFYTAKIRFKFLVERCFKGEHKPDTTFILTGLGNGDCGYPFVIGQSYIVFAYTSREEVFDYILLKSINKKNKPNLNLKSQTYYQTSICSWTDLYTKEMELGLINSILENNSELTELYSVPVVVKINRTILYDTAMSYPWLRNNYFKIQNERFYDSKKGMKKFGINSKWGVLSIVLRKGYTYP